MTEHVVPDESIPTSELSRNVGAVLDRVRIAGKHIEATRKGKPAAMLVPVDWWERACTAMAIVTGPADNLTADEWVALINYTRRSATGPAAADAGPAPVADVPLFDIGADGTADDAH